MRNVCIPVCNRGVIAVELKQAQLARQQLTKYVASNNKLGKMAHALPMHPAGHV